MTSGSPLLPRPCNECGHPIVLARRAGTDSWTPLDAADTPPSAATAGLCLVVVGTEAWRPSELVEQFMTSREISEEKARELTGGYPWHRPHQHERNPA